MRIFAISFDDLAWRNPWFKKDDLVCAVCQTPIPKKRIMACDDSDLVKPQSALCSVIYLCERCASDEPKIREVLREIAAEYDAENPDRAAVLRQMAESAVTA
jgi:hypothetical protein